MEPPSRSDNRWERLTSRLSSLFPKRTRKFLSRTFSSIVPLEKPELPDEVIQAIEQFVRPGNVVADIGANQGLCALRLAQSVGPEGKVHCFEPGPPFFEALKKSVAKATQCKEVFHLYPMGLSDKQCSLHWKQYEKKPEKANLTAAQGLEVPVTTLDEVIEGRWPRLDFIKAEVEGMELEVFRGAKETLARYRPVLFFESLMDFEEYRKAPVRKELVNFLRSMNYQLFRLDARGRKFAVDYPHLSEMTLAIPS